MSLAFCKQCEKLVEGNTHDCGACGVELCDFCSEPVIGVPEDEEDNDG